MIIYLMICIFVLGTFVGPALNDDSKKPNAIQWVFAFLVSAFWPILVVIMINDWKESKK